MQEFGLEVLNHNPPCPGILLTSMPNDPPCPGILLTYMPYDPPCPDILLPSMSQEGIVLTSMSQDPPRYFTYFYVPRPAQVFYLLLCPKTLLPGLFNDVVELVIELVILSTRSSPGFNACTTKCIMQKLIKTHGDILEYLLSK